MTKNFLAVLAAIGIAAPGLCSAELLVFKGSMNTRRSGNGGESRQPYRVFVVIDRESGNAAKIDYYTSGGFYHVNPMQSLTSSKIDLVRNRQQTVLATAATTVNESSQASVTSTFVRGTDTRLKSGPATYVVFPRILDWNDRGVIPTSDGSTAETWDETGVLNFDQTSTVYANSHGEALLDEQNRLIDYLQSKGYREIIVQ